MNDNDDLVNLRKLKLLQMEEYDLDSKLRLADREIEEKSIEVKRHKEQMMRLDATIAQLEREISRISLNKGETESQRIMLKKNQLNIRRGQA